MWNLKYKKKIILIGAGGHAKVIIDAIDKRQYEIVGILDKNKEHLHEKVNGIEIIGCDKDLDEIYKRGIRNAFVSIGHIGCANIRNKMFNHLKKRGFNIVNIVHPKSILATSVLLGEGNLIMPGCIINADVHIGNNNIVNTGTILEHEVTVENGVHIAPRTVVAGMTTIKDNTFIGAGSVIIQELKIGQNSIIGAGSVIIKNIPDNVVAVGNPAKIIKENRNGCIYYCGGRSKS